ncbi:thiosulfate sulfurtransferase-like isoform X1 [Mya arenaria]|uniref:thiosulfate sulfurtransferase-like isoform X1 n=1 Tax=Mya arenaria TaxID=6604 RepID=UPI0022E51F1F|nr:thiosulfate sulfurtransferase-like isoform X1 [Mya arenaria]
MSVPELVSCEWLQGRLAAGNTSGLVIVDVSWASNRDCHQDFKSKHIPGAQYMNILNADHSDLYPRAIPHVDTFTEMARAAGVNADSHVVVYSNSDKAGYFLSGRGWWSFKYFGHEKVSVLDGGLQKWLSSGFPTSSQSEAVTRGNFSSRVDALMLADYKAVCDNLQDLKFHLVDTRPVSAFSEDHIPDAVNLTMANIVDEEQGTMKSKDEIKQLFEVAGVNLGRPLVTQCNSGMSSCTVALAARLVGAADVRVFMGGFTEWKKRQNKDV